MQNVICLGVLLAFGAALGHPSFKYSGDDCQAIEAGAWSAVGGPVVGLPCAYDLPAHRGLAVPMHGCGRLAERQSRLGVRREDLRGRARLVAHWGVLGGP